MTLFHGLGIVAYSGVSGAAPGMVLLTPTSIAYSGTSASVGANGQVTFSAVTSLSLNGVFTADFDNYVVSFRHSYSSGNVNGKMRLRSSGTDASGSNYTNQYIFADGTSVTAGRDTSQTSAVAIAPSSTQRSGDTVLIYGPYLAQPTASRNIDARGASSAQIVDFACTHSLSASYDGVTFFVNDGANTFTGALQVYGVRS